MKLHGQLLFSIWLAPLNSWTSCLCGSMAVSAPGTKDLPEVEQPQLRRRGSSFPPPESGSLHKTKLVVLGLGR